MAVLILLAVGWLGLRTLVVLAQVERHSPGTQLGRRFQAELQARGLLQPPQEP